MNYTPLHGFPYYYELASEGDLQSLFSATPTLTLLQNIDKATSMYRYAADKWSTKQIIGHITDHERIKMFRAFQLSRREKVQLWGYDQESLVQHSQFTHLTTPVLLTDYYHVRRASLSFVNTLTPEQLAIKGMAREYEITLEAFLRSIIGHERHHLHVIQEKYLT